MEPNAMSLRPEWPRHTATQCHPVHMEPELEDVDYLYDGPLRRTQEPHENTHSYLFDQRLKDWRAILANAQSARLAWAGSIAQRSDSVDHAVRLIVAQFATDFVDLLKDIDQARGRSAVRTARSMMEHAINLATVLEDAAEAARYVAHLDLGYILAEDTLPLAFEGWIPGDFLRDMKHRLKVDAREPRKRFALATERYGRNFRRSWSTKNLHDRAKDQDVLGMYDLYRIASLTAHGSAGATIHDQRTDGPTTSIGIGMDLKQASLGYFMGLCGVFSVDGLLEQAGIDADWNHLHKATQPLVDRWGVYWWLTNRYDRNSYKKALDSLPPTILAISRTGATRWFVDQPQANQWQRGKPPILGDEQLALVGRISASLRGHAYFNKETDAQWIALRMPYVEAPVPDMNVKPIPNDAIELLPLPAIAAWDDNVHPELVQQLEEIQMLG